MHFGKHIQIVIRCRTISTDADIYTSLDEFGDWCETTGQF